MTAHDPLSTFAADVDTASYDIFRRDINDGRLPQPDSVRLEEYVNAFPYGYEAPSYDDEVPFSISLSAAVGPFLDETSLLRVGIKGRVPPPEEKKPANLVFLVDVSGSMASSDKLPLVQTLLLETLDVLDPDDTVSIVTYASREDVPLVPTPVSERGTIEGEIRKLNASGSTAGAAGINMAYEQAQAGFVNGGVNHVLLCTDGDFNVGISDTDELVDFIVEKRKTGITLTVVGFGTGNLNDEMMEWVSNAGNGIYSVISDEDQAVLYAQRRMLSTITLIAQDVKIQVELNPEQVAAYRLLGYENRAIEDDQFRDDRVDAGEIGAGHTVTALYELALTEAGIPKPAGAPEVEDGDPYEGDRTAAAEDLCVVRIRYKAVGAGEEDAAMEVSARLAAEVASGELYDADEDFRWAAAIAAFAEILKESPHGSNDDLGVIKHLLENAAGDDPDRRELMALFMKADQKLRAAE